MAARVSKNWNPGRKTVELRPSRIRRDPVRLESNARVEEARVVSREREMWGGVTGILLSAAALALVTVGISAATILRTDPAAASRAGAFGQCYNAFAYIAGEKVDIAGMDAPRIQGAGCADERKLGIGAATRLAALLNSGRVTVAGDIGNPGKAPRRKVEVDGQDVGEAMVSAGLARMPAASAKWCD